MLTALAENRGFARFAQNYAVRVSHFLRKMYLQPVEGCSSRAGRSASGFAPLVLVVTEMPDFRIASSRIVVQFFFRELRSAVSVE